MDGDGDGDIGLVEGQGKATCNELVESPLPELNPRGPRRRENGVEREEGVGVEGKTGIRSCSLLLGSFIRILASAYSRGVLGDADGTSSGWTGDAFN
jgi:hypothetical protein